MRIELRGAEPGKPHIRHVALVRDDGTRVEIPVREATLASLSTAAKKLAYVQECAEYHAGTGAGWMERKNARRAAWDADDKAKADAAAAAAKAAQDAVDAAARAEREAAEVLARAEAEALAAAQAKEAYERFVVTPVGFVEGGVRVSITHHNVTIPATIPADPATAEQNARAAFAAYEAAEAEKAAKLAAFAIG